MTYLSRLSLPVLSLVAVSVLSACSVEEPPVPGGGARAAGEGDPQPSVSTVADTAAVLEVKDQESEGPTVLAQAAATKGGFVVVYGDKGSNTLGTGIVPPGTTAQPVQISLAEQPTEEIELMARLFADTDGNGIYGAGDQPISNGEDDDSDDAETFAGEQELFTFKGKPVQD